ncbi:MAG: hypothetical protein CVU39_07035 [Chloroflexi bacterium HGW-Chloroflexi-10]|nr:MAG: hypothetical protein CVU39_07035 [Chloroflexi bacterium HGW-Chloroflexi-10]
MYWQTKKLNRIEKDRIKSQSNKIRLAPALGLFLLAPLIGEFLLGNLPITWLWVLMTMAPLYGGGALLIRESARRLKLGWPGMFILGIAYALVEEALVTQTLFNPNYLGLRLLDYGYISFFGIGSWWTVFVLGIHTIWSIAVPIALVESFTPDSRSTPWLSPLALVITAMVFAGGCFVTYTFQQDGSFVISGIQLIASLLAVALLVVVAIGIGRIQTRPQSKSKAAPSGSIVAGVAFILSSVFMALAGIVHQSIPAILNVSGMLGLMTAGSLIFWNWSNRSGWSEKHRLALVSGLILTYCWYGFVQVPSVGDTSPLIDLIGNSVFSIGAILLLVLAWKRSHG